MKLRGEFVIHQVVDEILAIPVGDIALEFNGMIMLNNVSKVIWECLEKGAETEEIVTSVTDQFDVSKDEAEQDIIAFINRLREINLIEE